MIPVRVLHPVAALPTGIIVMLALGIPLAIIVTVLVTKTFRLENELLQDGIIADAVVVRCRAKRKDGKKRYYPTVRYRASDGKEHEASINVRTNLPVGRKLKIKYLPGKYDYVAFVSQELGTGGYNDDQNE